MTDLVSDQIDKIKLRFKKLDPSKWDQIESEQPLRDISVLLYYIEINDRLVKAAIRWRDETGVWADDERATIELISAIDDIKLSTL